MRKLKSSSSPFARRDLATRLSPTNALDRRARFPNVQSRFVRELLTPKRAPLTEATPRHAWPRALPKLATPRSNRSHFNKDLSSNVVVSATRLENAKTNETAGTTRADRPRTDSGRFSARRIRRVDFDARLGRDRRSTARSPESRFDRPVKTPIEIPDPAPPIGEPQIRSARRREIVDRRATVRARRTGFRPFRCMRSRWARRPSRRAPTQRRSRRAVGGCR